MNAQARRLFGFGRAGDDSEHWLTISDLMAGLMMVFLFSNYSGKLSTARPTRAI